MDRSTSGISIFLISAEIVMPQLESLYLQLGILKIYHHKFVEGLKFSIV